MATRDEIVDQIAGLRAVRRPDDAAARTASPTRSRSVVFAEGERVLRQGLSGSAFHIILDGEAEVVIDGAAAGHARARRLLRRGLDPARRAARRRLVALAPAALPRPRRAGRSQPFLLDNPPVMYRMLQAQARRLRNANRWRS